MEWPDPVGVQILLIHNLVLDSVESKRKIHFLDFKIRICIFFSPTQGFPYKPNQLVRESTTNSLIAFPLCYKYKCLPFIIALSALACAGAFYARLYTQNQFTHNAFVN